MRDCGGPDLGARYHEGQVGNLRRVQTRMPSTIGPDHNYGVNTAHEARTASVATTRTR